MFQISLKAARVNAELKQTEAAKLIGIASKTLQNYENGVNPIPAFALRKAAKVYGIDEDYIKIPNVDDGEFDEDEKNLCKTTV